MNAMAYFVSVLVSTLIASIVYMVPSSYELKIKKLSMETREKFKNRLPKLEKPNYAKVFGNRPRDKEIELGRLLFNDPIMSRNNDVSCATCHLANHGYADGNSLMVGTMGRGGPNGDNVGKIFGEGKLSDDRTLGDDGFGTFNRHFMFRNSLSTINTIFRQNNFTDRGLFHDGRFGALRFMVLLPIHTREEMCGSNRIVLDKKGENIFRENGPIFKDKVYISHSNSYDPYSGKDTGRFHAKAEYVKGIKFRRGNNQISVPNRNECLAITIAKIRSVPEYRRLFYESYGDKGVTDKLLARALAAFISSHVADDSPYDRFIKGKDVLSEKQLLGLNLYMTDSKENVSFNGKTYQGAGCINCHDGGTFGGDGFATLGIRSDRRSPLTQDQSTIDKISGFFSRTRSQRGYVPKCLIDGVTVFKHTDYSPDIGLAAASFDGKDCFKFRIPPLRNVIETYPYYHHGTETAQGEMEDNFVIRARKALKNVIEYHLRGPIDIVAHNRFNAYDPFNDNLFQRDFLVPFAIQNFDRKMGRADHKHFPIKLDDDAVEALVEFVGIGLWDKTAVQKGYFGNDLSHPKRVPSGFTPTITRDKGHQLELPPNSIMQNH